MAIFKHGGIRVETFLVSCFLLAAANAFGDEPNLALGKKVEASSYENERLKAENAVDGKKIRAGVPNSETRSGLSLISVNLRWSDAL